MANVPKKLIPPPRRNTEKPKSQPKVTAEKVNSQPQKTTENTKSQSTNCNPRDLDRKRAKIAWENIKEIKQQSPEQQKKYGTIAYKLPTLIQVNGLAQTLAFLKAKGETHHKKALKHLSDWVCKRFQWHNDTDLNDTDLLGKLLLQNTDTQQYRLATAEALAFLQWLKRFAEAELEREDS
ncbi:MAG: type III-B CRISPR module-associated protein Cmr5 [Spirulinaceae cyanobacterium]